MKALVIGLGISGKGAVKLLRHLGYQVTGVDRDIANKNIEGALLFSESDFLSDFDFNLVVISPGICQTHPLAVRAKKKGIEIIGEVELALRSLKNPCIGITGTNGKTTLTLLLTHIFNASGKKAQALGNIGTSLSEQIVHLGPKTIVVLELSSFQLETISTPAFDCGVITSITPDHLDRYPSFESYARVKGYLSYLIKPNGFLCIGFGVNQFKHFFSPLILKKIIDLESYLQVTPKERYLEMSETLQMAYAVCERFGVKQNTFYKAQKGFTPPPHRLELLGEIESVWYYNDSKATNVEAVGYALKKMSSQVLLIVGGEDKGASFEIWKELFKGKVKKIFAIGKTAPLIEKTLKTDYKVEMLPDLERAFRQAKRQAQPGEVVLLSPGCASFDQFKNFEERGNHFKELFQKFRS